MVSKQQHDELRAKLSDTEQALADAEKGVTALKKAVENLKVLKDAAEVAEILLPERGHVGDLRLCAIRQWMS